MFIAIIQRIDTVYIRSTALHNSAVQVFFDELVHTTEYSIHWRYMLRRKYIEHFFRWNARLYKPRTDAVDLYGFLSGFKDERHVAC